MEDVLMTINRQNGVVIRITRDSKKDIQTIVSKRGKRSEETKQRMREARARYFAQKTE